MKDSRVYVGIDISKDSFDVYSPVHGHQKYENDKNGFMLFIASLKLIVLWLWKLQEVIISYAHEGLGSENSKQLPAYFGLAPSERSSGSSVRGRSRITKAGQVMVQNHLFLCSFSACIYNKKCKAFYERLVAKGKSKKLALVAVCNKLLKQGFAIAHFGNISH